VTRPYIKIAGRTRPIHETLPVEDELEVQVPDIGSATVQASRKVGKGAARRPVLCAPRSASFIRLLLPPGHASMDEPITSQAAG
jgi:hypothetical protein